MNQKGVKILEKGEIVGYLESELLPKKGSEKLLIITAGAGDIDTVVQPVRNLLNDLK